MNDAPIRIRANRSTGELEVEGPPQAVLEWWDKLWPELSAHPAGHRIPPGQPHALPPSNSSGHVFDTFGEFTPNFDRT